MKIRAAVLDEFGQPLNVTEVELAEPREGEVLVGWRRAGSATPTRVCGSSFGGVKGRDGVPALVQLYLDGQLDVDPFISHRIGLDQVDEGFELMERQAGIRTVIEFS
jgi:Zn-dependent alcohol dehydrogenase